MQIDELKKVMRIGFPVKHRDIRYNHISAIIYRRTERGLFFQVELLDKRTNSVVLANPAEVEMVGDNG